MADLSQPKDSPPTTTTTCELPNSVKGLNSVNNLLTLIKTEFSLSKSKKQFTNKLHLWSEAPTCGLENVSVVETASSPTHPDWEINALEEAGKRVQEKISWQLERKGLSL